VSPLRAALAILALATVGLAACGSDDGEQKPQPKLRVVVTTAQAADFLRATGGSRVEVDQLIPNGQDPHFFYTGPGTTEATRLPDRMVKLLHDADLVIRSGGGLDAWLPALAERAGVEDIDVVDLSKAVVLRERRDVVDFHWWQDPRNAAAAALKIRDELIKRDPDGSRPYRAAAARYRRKIARLDRAAASCLARVPADARKLFTAHEAFGYLAARYRLTVVGAATPAMTTNAPTLDVDSRPLVRSLHKAPAAFAEHDVDSSLLKNLARQAGAPVISALWSDTLGPPGSSDARYVDAFADNVKTIAASLGAPSGSCELPA